MRRFLFFITTIIATNTFGQTKNEEASETFLNKPKIQVSETGFGIIYADKYTCTLHPAYFINGKLLTNAFLPANIDPQNIKNIEVVKRDTLINNVKYRDQLYIVTKEDYSPRFITLTELKNKYTNLKGKPVIFMLDGNFITSDYETFMVDETNLLSIFIDNIQMTADKIDLGLIKILTNTVENIKAKQNIMIRGEDVTIRN